MQVASLFHPKAKQWIDGRRGLMERIEQQVGPHSGETLWVHCASLGEFEMARPVMEQLKRKDPSLRIILTFFSPSGYEVRKNYEVADHVFYLPLDTTSNAKRFVRAIKPNTVLFVKYDLWFHHLYEAEQSGAKLLLISAQFRPDQQYFKFYGSIGRKALRLFNRIFLVDENSAKLLREIDVTDTVVCGDTRYDRVMETAKTTDSIAEIESFKGDSKLVICGSTWPEDEKLLAQCASAFPNIKWVIAPHEVGPENVARSGALFPDSQKLSSFSKPRGNVLIVDSIGMLNRLYRYADVAYVGGAFRTGLHNILEATAFGVPTVFGPDHSRFPDAGEMVQKELAFSIRNEKELLSCFRQLLHQDQTELRTRLLAFMESRTGATRTIVEYTNDC